VLTGANVRHRTSHTTFTSILAEVDLHSSTVHHTRQWPTTSEPWEPCDDRE